MSSLFQGLGEYMGGGAPPIVNQKVNTSFQIFYGHVLDVVIDENSLWYKGPDSIGAVRARILPFNYNKNEDLIEDICYPLDRTHFRVPFPGEQILGVASFGPAVQGFYMTRLYYWKIISADQVLSYSRQPFTGTDPYHIKPGPEILVDVPTEAKRFDGKLGVDIDLLRAQETTIQKPRTGERTIESRFGAMIKFTSTPAQAQIWSEDQVNNQLASSDGDPMLILNVDRKPNSVGPKTNLASNLVVKDVDPSQDDTSMYFTTRQNVPIKLSCSQKMATWDFEVRRGNVSTNTGASATLAKEFGGGYDPNSALTLKLVGTIIVEESDLVSGDLDNDLNLTPSQGAKNGAPHLLDGTAYQRALNLDGFTYGLGSKVTDEVVNAYLARGKTQPLQVDCSGFVSYVLGVSGGSYSLVENSNSVKQVATIDATTLQEGDVIGSDNGPRYKEDGSQWDGNRTTGIDHIGVVLKNPADQSLIFAESHGNRGVHIRSLADGIKAWNSYGVKNNFGTAYIDPSDGKTKTKSFWIGNYRPATTV